jgi:hypothetical protein
VVCYELCEEVIWPEGEGQSVEDGGNTWFGVGPSKAPYFGPDYGTFFVAFW